MIGHVRQENARTNKTTIVLIERKTKRNTAKDTVGHEAHEAHEARRTRKKRKTRTRR